MNLADVSNLSGKEGSAPKFCRRTLLLGAFVSAISAAGCAQMAETVASSNDVYLNTQHAAASVEIWNTAIALSPPIKTGLTYEKLVTVNRQMLALSSHVIAPNPDFVLFNSQGGRVIALGLGRVGIDLGLVQACENNSQIAAFICQRIAALTIAGNDPQKLKYIYQAVFSGLHTIPLSPVAAEFEAKADAMALDMLAKCGFDPRDGLRLAVRGGAYVNEYLPQATRKALIAEKLQKMGYQV